MRPTSRILIAGFLGLAFDARGVADPTGGYPKRAPFEAVRWRGEMPEISVDGAWCELISLDGVEAKKILDFCKTTYGDRWQKRFAEDLHEVLSRMGKPPGDSVDLIIRPTGGRESIAKPKVAMTEAKRRSVMRSQPRDDSPVRVQRPAQSVARAEAQADLKALEQALSERYSYLTLRSYDWRVRLKEISRDLPERVERADLAMRIMMFLAPFGDGHTRVENGESHLPGGYLPFLVGEADGKLVAFKEDRSGLVDADRPYLVSIDGLAIEEWLKATESVVAHGAPDYRRFHSVRMLRYVAFLRTQLKLPPGDTLRVELASRSGAIQKRTMRLGGRPPRYGAWPRRQTGVLSGDIGYLRFDRMDDDAKFLKALDESLERFRETRGLIIDVRGNGGGSREALRRLFPYFVGADDEPCVVNVARYRLGPGEKDDPTNGHLANRFLYPAEWAGWSEPQRGAIAQFVKSFKPQWNAPDGQFSGWHYMVLDRSSNAKAFHYDRPVVVLIDTACFSATDIFASALKGRKNITLMGTRTGGGSGRVRPIELPASGLMVLASSMASYRADGSLYDGEGIAPDVTVLPAQADYLDTSDSVLDAARERIVKPAVR